MDKHTSRGEWSSLATFVLAATGAAVGLGNIWKFPYMVGDNGGSAFVLLYLFFIFVIGIPIMLAEMLIGKCGKQNPVNSIVTLAIESGASTRWCYAGWIGIVTLLLVLSFYSVVASWSLAYFCKTIMGSLVVSKNIQVVSIWQQFLADPAYLLFWDTIYMVMTMWIVARGLKKGLEAASKYMMPALFIVLIVLVCYAITTPGFYASLNYLLAFKYQAITSDVAIDALGHAFFSLAIGAGCMLVFGSYLPANIRLTRAVFVVVILDVFVAILSGVAIFSVVFSNHLSPQGGPGLMFEVLPIAFNHMQGGMIIGALFFLLLVFAAWSSSISMAEPLVILLQERHHLSRRAASLAVGIVAWILSIGSLLSFNIWENVKLFGRWNFFTVITDLVTNILQPLGGLLFAVFVGWVMQQSISEKELAWSSSLLYQLWLYSLRIIAPLAIAIIMISSIIY